MVVRGLIALCTKPKTQVKAKKNIASGRITSNPPKTVLFTNSLSLFISLPSFRFYWAVWGMCSIDSKYDFLLAILLLLFIAF